MKGDIAILADSGVRTGLDVVRMIALGADSVLLGRPYLYALATSGQAGVANLLNLIENEMKVAMTLTGTKSIKEINKDSLVHKPAAMLFPHDEDADALLDEGVDVVKSELLNRFQNS